MAAGSPVAVAGAALDALAEGGGTVTREVAARLAATLPPGPAAGPPAA